MDATLESQPPLLRERQDAPYVIESNEKAVSKKVLDSEVTIKSNVIGVLTDERDIVTHVITIDDDTSSSPWTYRAFIIGMGLSVFAGAFGKYLVG
jgi:hypothetical protein